MSGSVSQSAQVNPVAGPAGQPPQPGGFEWYNPFTWSSAGSSTTNAAGTQGVSAGSTVSAPNLLASALNTVSASQQPVAIPNPLPAQQNLNDTAGRRVRLRPKPAVLSQILGNGLMTPLINTSGMLFPYQPTITWSQDINYTNLETVHTNQDFYSYSKTPALKFSVEGDFTVQNQTEGLYALGCIHFLRTVSKMNFGQNDPNAGTPPPVLLFDAYGQYMFNALPVIVTQFTITLPKDVDYVAIQASALQNTSFIIPPPPSQLLSQTTQPITPQAAAQAFANINQNQFSQYNPAIANVAGNPANWVGYAWLPAVFNITVQLVVQNTPQRLRAFNLGQFRSGYLLTQGTWI
jgi:hypothetical protein